MIPWNDDTFNETFCWSMTFVLNQFHKTSTSNNHLQSFLYFIFIFIDFKMQIKLYFKNSYWVLAIYHSIYFYFFYYLQIHPDILLLFQKKKVFNNIITWISFQVQTFCTYNVKSNWRRSYICCRVCFLVFCTE